jgi:hypothetical protein
MLHVAVRLPVYPELHVGTHVYPVADPAIQFPGPAFNKLGVPAQAELVQDPVVDQTPFVHVAERVPVYPEIHVGTHEEPEAASETQFPAPALVIEGNVVQEVVEQVPVLTSVNNKFRKLLLKICPSSPLLPLLPTLLLPPTAQLEV